MSDPAPPSVGAPRLDRAVAVGIAAVVALLGFLPISNWIPGGEHDRAFGARWLEWGYGSLIALGVAVVAAILVRSSPLVRGALDAVGRSCHRAFDRLGASRWFDAWLFGGSLLAYALIARFVFSARPLLIDELVQVFQARIYASGHLFTAVDAYPEFFSMLHVVDTGDKVYAQFPPGGPAMLALGELVRATWLVGPVCGAVAAVLFGRLVRASDPGASPAYRASASLLFAAAPFAAFMFASHMNHGPTLMWIMLAIASLAVLVRADRYRGSRRDHIPALLCGFGFGAAATIRPLDAFAFALPAGCWLGFRALRDRSTVSVVVAAAAGLAVPFGAMLWANTQTTGSPFLFGYEVLWGAAHGLGFHAAPWGTSHTPARGLELISLYLTRLNSYLFETPFPALLPSIVSLALMRRLSAFDRYLLASAVLLGGLYFMYWHDGFFLGPRFVFAWLPLLVLLAARLPRLVAERFPAGPTRAGLWGALVAGAALAVSTSIPSRIAQYRGGLTSMRVDYAAESRAASVSNALVFVRESWGAQIVARMWAQQVSRSAAAALYAKVDACSLDRSLRELERTRVRGRAAEQRLALLLGDSSRVRSSPFSPDSTEKVLPGAAYDSTCLRRINEDRVGYALLPPIALERESGNIYVRDLHARDSVLVMRYPQRAVYLLRRDGAEAGAPLHWLSLRRDSLFAAWRAGTR